MERRAAAPPESLAQRAGYKPPGALVHGVLLLVQVIFGVGAVVGKLGVSSFNPLLFALIRETCAGGILAFIAYKTTGFRIDPKDIAWFMLAGFWLFSNQAGFIVGEKLSSAVIGSAWQPSQPIFIIFISIALGWERATIIKMAGILIAFMGAAFMVTTSSTKFGKIEVDPGSSVFLGNVLFFFNCFGTAAYVITARQLLRKYASWTVTGGAYMCASLMMTVVAVTVTLIPSGVHFVCPVKESDDDKHSEVYDCGDHYTNYPEGCSCPPWKVPNNAILPLVYWILINSVVAYLCMTWANAHADPSSVLAYTAVQPLTSSTLTVVITSFTSKYDLKRPGYNMLGGILIIIGLFLLVHEQRRKTRRLLLQAQLLDVDSDFHGR